jgi:peptidoglycan/LPS O-acetylase OafA/YrhL
MCSFPWNVFFALGAAFLSYALIEKPALNLRRKIEARLFQRADRVTPVTALQSVP